MKRSLRSTIVGIGLFGGSMITFAQQPAAPYTIATRYNIAGQISGTIASDPDGSGTLDYPATRNTYGTTGVTAGLLLKTEVGQLSAWVNETVAPAAWSGFTVYKTHNFGYDSYGRKTSERVVGQNGTTTESLIQYSYDSWDRVICKAVRMNPAVFSSPNTDACQVGAEGIYGPDRITRFSYDAFDQVLTEERGLGTPNAQTYVTNTYYGRGVLQFQTDAKGNKTELRYDSNWRLHKRVYPSKFTPGSVNESDYNAYTYDKNGNVQVERKRNATTITNTYDANNRLIFKDLSDNAYSGDISYGYDLRGLTRYSCFGSASTNVCETSGEGESSAYDGLGNVKTRISRMNGVARTLAYQYDLEGNRTRITHPDGYFFEYAYDGLNRFNSLRVSLAATPTSSTGSGLAVRYRASGGRRDITRAGTGAAVTTINPDNALRLQSFAQDFSGTNNDLTNTFAYSPSGQIASLTQANTLYNYSEAMNRTGSYQSNGLNQYDLVDGRALDYDTSGNLIADRSSEGALTNYIYDMENHLVTVSGVVSGNLYYDALGRLSRMVTGGNTTQFLYDGDSLVAEYLNGSLSRRYVHGDRADEPLLQYNGTNLATRRYLHADHQGSIVAHSDTTGGVTQKNAYDPYGIPAAANDGRFGFTGQAWLKEIGLNYYRARIYSPRLGRFLQSDPVFYKDDMNIYGYTGNDPVNKKDPSGMVAETLGMDCFAMSTGIGSVCAGPALPANGEDAAEGKANAAEQTRTQQPSNIDANGDALEADNAYVTFNNEAEYPVEFAFRGDDSQLTGSVPAGEKAGIFQLEPGEYRITFSGTHIGPTGGAVDLAANSAYAFKFLGSFDRVMRDPKEAGWNVTIFSPRLYYDVEFRIIFPLIRKHGNCNYSTNTFTCTIN